MPQGFCGRASPVWARLGCREGFFKLVRNLCTCLRPVREAALPSARRLGFLLKVDAAARRQGILATENLQPARRCGPGQPRRAQQSLWHLEYMAVPPG